MLYGYTQYERLNEPNSENYESPCDFCKYNNCHGCEYYDEDLGEELENE